MQSCWHQRRRAIHRSSKHLSQLNYRQSLWHCTDSRRWCCSYQSGQESIVNGSGHSRSCTCRSSRLKNSLLALVTDQMIYTYAAGLASIKKTATLACPSTIRTGGLASGVDLVCEICFGCGAICTRRVHIVSAVCRVPKERLSALLNVIRKLY